MSFWPPAVLFVLSMFQSWACHIGIRLFFSYQFGKLWAWHIGHSRFLYKFGNFGGVKLASGVFFQISVATSGVPNWPAISFHHLGYFGPVKIASVFLYFSNFRRVTLAPGCFYIRLAMMDVSCWPPAVLLYSIWHFLDN